MTKESIEITRDWALTPKKVSTIKLTTYTNGVANAVKICRC